MDRGQSLLLTATVIPHANMPNLKVTGSEARLQQYCDAFGQLVASHCTRLFDTIYVAENSGYDMKAFERVFRTAQCAVKYLPIEADPSQGSFGRGYSEMCLIDQALHCARAVDEAKRGTFFWKLTGRYEVANLENVLRVDHRAFDIIINQRMYPRKYADLYLFGFRKEAWIEIYKHLEKFKESGESTITEIVMYDLIGQFRKEASLRIKDRLPREPHLRGIRGWDHRQYDSGVQRFKRHVRQVLRVIAPQLKV